MHITPVTPVIHHVFIHSFIHNFVAELKLQSAALYFHSATDGVLRCLLLAQSVRSNFHQNKFCFLIWKDLPPVSSSPPTCGNRNITKTGKANFKVRKIPNSQQTACTGCCTTMKMGPYSFPRVQGRMLKYCWMNWDMMGRGHQGQPVSSGSR